MYYLITDTASLIQAFAGYPFEVLSDSDRLVSSLQSDDTVVLSAPLVAMQVFGEIRKRYPDTEIYYVCDHTPTQMEGMLASTNKIQLIPPGDPALVPAIVETGRAESQTAQRKLVAFIGAVPNIGLTQTVLSIADSLSSSIEDIGVLGLNLYDEGPVQDAESNLNSIKPYLSEAEFAITTLQRYLITRKFSYLPGNREYLQIYYYTPEEARALLDVSSQTFSLTLADCGAYLDTAMACETLQAADLIFLFTQDTPKSFDRLEKSYVQVLQRLGLDTDRMATIVMGANNRNLTKFRALPSIADIPHLHYRDVQLAERSGQYLTTLNDPAYQQGIQRVAQVIAARYSMTLEVATTKMRPTFFGRRG